MMEHVRKVWTTDEYENNERCCGDDVYNMAQLLPIEMINLCDKASYFDPILVY